jgi:plastocyanin
VTTVSLRSSRHAHGLRLSIGAVVLAIGLSASAASIALAATSSVRMIESNDRYAFSPATRVVHAGDKVTWTNTTDAPHTVRSDTGGTISSPTVGPGQTFSFTFASTGTFAYHCSIHSYMRGTVEVLAAGATLPATDTSPTTITPRENGFPRALLAALAGLFAFAFSLRTVRKRTRTNPLPEG